MLCELMRLVWRRWLLQKAWRAEAVLRARYPSGVARLHAAERCGVRAEARLVGLGESCLKLPP